MPEIIPNLHPLVVHFPIALISLSALFHVIALAARRKPYAHHCATIAHSMLWLGALSAVFAVVFGWVAFNSVNHDESGHVAMLVHRGWALATLAVLIALAGWDAWRSKVDTVPLWWFTAAVIGAWSMVAVTAWHGGELVYRHGLGVMALPAVETGHVHVHDDADHDKDSTHSHAGDEKYEHSTDWHEH